MFHVSARTAAVPAALEFLTGGGEMGRRIREKDWSGTPLGDVRGWPSALKSTMRVVLASRQPLCVWWGVECTLLYNDACRPLLGSSGESALGGPAPSAWLAGNSQVSAIVGDGAACREANYALALNPVPGDNGELGGVLCTFVDVTRAERAEQELALAETLQQIARDLTSELELENLMQKVTDAATRLTGAAFGEFVRNTANETGEGFQAFKPIFDGEGPVRVADITADPRYGQWAPHHGRGHWPVRSYLAVPVISRTGAVLGGLFFGHPDTGVFGQRAERNAVAIASHASVAIDNAQLFSRVNQELERREHFERELAEQVASLTRLHDLALRLGGMNELAPALQAILDTAVEGQDADFGLVWLQERDTGALVVRAGRGFDEKALQFFQRVMPGEGGGAAGNAFAHQSRWVIEDVDRDPGFEPFRSGAHDAGFRSVHSTPIVTRAGQLLGAISVHFKRKPRPTQRDMQVADVCARHAADVIEAMRSGEDLRASVERLEQVERELRELDERKNEFLATLAHELRNPLAPLRNGLEVLRLAGSNPQTADKARGMMERQLAQMVRLVDDLLDVSRVSRGKIDLRREDVELATVLRNAIETSQPLISERRQQLRTSIPAEGIQVNADVTRLSQVFWNLLNNAAKYTEPNGTIELGVRAEEGHVEVTVRDNGIGIPPDMQARVFDIFTQVDRTLEKSQGGLGIGLSIAKRLVEMHGGNIAVKSDGHRRGSEFIVRLPARLSASTATTRAA